MSNMNNKYIVLSYNGLKDILSVVSAGNPPDGMTRKEWLDQIRNLLKKDYNKMKPEFIRTQSFLRAERAINTAEPVKSVQALDNP